MSSRRVRVGDVLALDRILVEPQATRGYVTIGIRSFGKGIFHYDEKPGDQVGKLRFFKLNPGRLVLSNIKAWEGAIAVSTEDDGGCVASNRFLAYQPVDDRIDVDWARWFFLSEGGLPLIQQASPGSADRNRTLAMRRFEDLQIPLPPLDEQRRVAERLGRLQEGSTGLQLLAARAKRITSALPASLALRPDFTEEKRLRAGWRELQLGEVMSPSPSQVRVEASATYQVAGIYSFGRGLIDRGLMKGSDTSYKSFTRLALGDVALSKLNGWEGAVAVVPPAFDGFCVSTEYPVFRLDQSVVLPQYFDGVARAPLFWAELDRKARGSMVRRRRINPADFLRAAIWVPPIEDQRRTAAILASLEALPEHRNRALDRVTALLPAALNEAFGVS